MKKTFILLFIFILSVFCIGCSNSEIYYGSSVEFSNSTDETNYEVAEKFNLKVDENGMVKIRIKDLRLIPWIEVVVLSKISKCKTTITFIEDPKYQVNLEISKLEGNVKYAGKTQDDTSYVEYNFDNEPFEDVCIYFSVKGFEKSSVLLTVALDYLLYDTTQTYVINFI